MATTTFRASLTSNPANINTMGVAAGSEYASVDIQNVGGGGGVGPHYAASALGTTQRFRSLKPTPVTASTTAGLTAATGCPPASSQALAMTMRLHQLQQQQKQQAYNLGNFFPRIGSEPPARKSYGTAGKVWFLTVANEKPFLFAVGAFVLFGKWKMF